MKRMIRYGMKPVRYRIVVINVLLALALTLLVNFSFFLIGADPRGRRPPIRTDYVVVQVVYFSSRRGPSCRSTRSVVFLWCARFC